MCVSAPQIDRERARERRDRDAQFIAGQSTTLKCGRDFIMVYIIKYIIKAQFAFILTTSHLKANWPPSVRFAMGYVHGCVEMVSLPNTHKLSALRT